LGRESLESESEPHELSKEVEAALAALRPSPEGAGTDFLYRSKLLVAISSLPPDERQVVELLLWEYPIDSQDTEVKTIVRIIGCTEKTVRNRRDRAFAKLREALKEEEA
jgi:DNA-directed RNA polymerase specialized sigma24 family protein